MNLIKSELTFGESIRFINSVCDSCFTTDENGNDIDYSSASKHPLIQATFCEYYTDMEFLPTEDEEGNEIEGAFDKNFSSYMTVDINQNWHDVDYKVLNRQQLAGILSAIDEQIEFRKQKMLSQNNEVSKLVTDLLKENIENVKLQKKATNEILEMNKKYQKKDIDKMVKVIDNINKNMKNPAYQKELVSKLVDVSKEVNEEE